jgi:hypothetical protein
MAAPSLASGLVDDWGIRGIWKASSLTRPILQLARIGSRLLHPSEMWRFPLLCSHASTRDLIRAVSPLSPIRPTAFGRASILRATHLAPPPLCGIQCGGASPTALQVPAAGKLCGRSVRRRSSHARLSAVSRTRFSANFNAKSSLAAQHCPATW